jgi:GT2 family glycosyltransferase
MMEEERQPEPGAGRFPAVSVIVPVRNDAARLRALIDRLAAQTIPREQFEVVIGDDGSAPDALAGIATAEGWVRVSSGPRQTSYAARNRAAAVARSDVLAFCDSDCAPEPEWLEEGLAALADADLVAGEVIYAPPARPTAWSLLTIDMYLDQRNNVLLSRGVTANLFVKRHLFDELGGFDESLPSGGDYDLVRRAVDAGARLVYAPAAVVRHPTIDDRRSFLRKVRRTNRWSTVRRGRAGEAPDIHTALAFLPVYGVRRARLHALRPVWRLQQQRLEAAGLAPSWRKELLALTVLYVVVGYVSAWARARGWFDARAFRESATHELAGLPDAAESITAQASDGSA